MTAKFINCSVNSGKLASFWFDNWILLGSLINHIGRAGPRNFRLHANATISEACDRSGWRLPSPRSDSALALHVHLTTITPPSFSISEDSYIWCIEQTKLPNYSSCKTWDVLRPRSIFKAWSSSVWFKKATPKNAFLLWTAQLNRLSTRARLGSWGLLAPSHYCLCSAYEETREHLMLSCAFSKDI